MTEIGLVLGERDGFFELYPPGEEGAPYWLFCLTDKYEEQLRAVVRDERHGFGFSVLHISWNPGDADALVIPVHDKVKLYRLMVPPEQLPCGDLIKHNPPWLMRLPFPLIDFFESLVDVEGEERGEEIQEATLAEIRRRIEAGELSAADQSRIRAALEQVARNHRAYHEGLRKILAKYDVVPSAPFRDRAP